MPEFATGSWRDVADDAGLRMPASGMPGRDFAVAWLAGAALAFLVGRGTGFVSRLDVAVLLSVVLYQPVVEELLFRGVVQGYLLRTSHGARAMHGVTVANMLASVLFALAHLAYQPPAWALAVLVPSLAFGYFRDRTGSVVAPIVLHVSFNAMFFLGRTLIG